MKKCGYCGKEYADDATHCLGDQTPLSDVEPPPTATVATYPTPSPGPDAEPTPNRQAVPEPRERIFELVVVCTIAFGSNILVSFFYLINQYSTGSGSSALVRWLNASLHEVTGLALLWYVLRRRLWTWSNLGFKWRRTDFGFSLLLFTVAYAGSAAIYHLIHYAGLSSVDLSTASARVGIRLFGGGISTVTVLFQFLNPFYEELIVRAYVMTEVKQLTGSATKAILISTALQTSYHFYQGAPLAFSDGALFLVFSLYYAKTNRITPIILAHMYCDVIPTLLYLARHP